MRARWISVAALVAATAAPSNAAAESAATEHAVAAGIDWIARVPEARLPSRAERPVVCLVDTGVAVTPDTPATSPEGPILARLSVYQDDGTAAGTEPKLMHGTMLAAAIVAPANGWGIVGVWPGAQLVSVRASTPDGIYDSAAIARGMQLCQNWSLENKRPLAAVNLSLGSYGPDPAQQARMQNRVDDFNAQGVSVVAAAGNVAGRGTASPASTPNAIAVGAGTLAGGWCPTASHDSLTDVVAPGCNVTAADPITGMEGLWPDGGSSHAAAVVSAVIAALRSLRPDATRKDVETWITTSGNTLDGARILNGTAIATAAGLADLATPAGPTPPPAAAPAPAAAAPALTAPTQLKVRREGRNLVVNAGKAPDIDGVRLQATVRVKGKWVRASGKRSATLRRVGRPARIWIRWTTPAGASSWTPYTAKSTERSRPWLPGKIKGKRPPVSDTR